MKLLLAKFIFAGVLALFFSGCAGVPLSQPVNQADCRVVQGGSFAGEGMINFPLGLPNDKK
ncbi:MAG: hypothetical protein ACLPYB_09460 [Desulfobaccales bacterium]